MSKYKLIINLKTYEESNDKKAIKIAKICKKLEKEAKKKNVEIILCPQLLDLRNIVKEKVSVFSQHIDDYNYGAYTGYIVPKNVKLAGAIGTLINHSEHRLTIKEIETRIKIAKELGLISCVCTRNIKETEVISKFKPDFIAIEPKELIGGDISISTAKPELIKLCVKASKKVPLLVGAGVKNSNDVKIAIKLGSKGILVASGVIKAKNIENSIKDLLTGF